MLTPQDDLIGHQLPTTFDHVGTSDPDALDTFEDNYFGRWDSMVAFVEELLDDFGIERALDDAVPAPWRYYIRVDTDALARDLATFYGHGRDPYSLKFRCTHCNTHNSKITLMDNPYDRTPETIVWRPVKVKL